MIREYADVETKLEIIIHRFRNNSFNADIPR